MKRHRFKKRDPQRGMTLFELLLLVGTVGFLLLLAITGAVIYLVKHTG